MKEKSGVIIVRVGTNTTAAYDSRLDLPKRETEKKYPTDDEEKGKRGVRMKKGPIVASRKYPSLPPFYWPEPDLWPDKGW